MAENQENNKDKKAEKKPKFNTNWIFVILLVSIIGFEFIFSGKDTKKAGQREVEEMIIHHDIEKIVVVNKEHAEIYLKKDSLKTGSYPDLANKKRNARGCS